MHCVQGLSRSATVVAAYRALPLLFRPVCLLLTAPFVLAVMYSRNVQASEAMEIVRRGTRHHATSLALQTELTGLTFSARTGLDYPRLSGTAFGPVFLTGCSNNTRGLQEQLVLFGLCRFQPSPSEGIYVKWRQKIDRYIQQQAQGSRR